MTIKDDIKRILPLESLDNYYIVADFDRTITDGHCKTSWTILGSSSLVPEGYISESDSLHKEYKPIEMDETMDLDKRVALIEKWYRLHIELFAKYQISEELFEVSSKNSEHIEFRPGAKAFLDFLHEKNIPLIIISAGVKNLIECFLKNNGCYYENIYICSNEIIIKDGVAIGVGENIIHSLNKNEIALPENIKKKIQTRPNVVLLGDQRGDLKMVDESKHEDVIKVAFLNKESENEKEDFKELFDIVMEPSEGFDELIGMLI